MLLSSASLQRVRFLGIDCLAFGKHLPITVQIRQYQDFEQWRCGRLHERGTHATLVLKCRRNKKSYFLQPLLFTPKSIFWGRHHPRYWFIYWHEFIVGCHSLLSTNLKIGFPWTNLSYIKKRKKKNARLEGHGQIELSLESTIFRGKKNICQQF